jgi:hypothetical protein
MTDEQKIAELIERAVGGASITDEEVMALAGSDLIPAAGVAWHLLVHWMTDADIRARDPAMRPGRSSK